jgi:hypothetical protein
MSEPQVVQRRAVIAGWGANRILLVLAFLVFLVGFCMSLGFIVDKPDDLRDLFGVGFAGLALWVLASLA